MIKARFDGRVAIITGAAGGIGTEIEVRLAAERGVPVIADFDLKAGYGGR
jgi:3-hydroxybutyrate dehydrogenase